ncbi:hypothetical protein ASF21_09070 [Arthrobacter sp. Leaf234]|uniref:hypothetical protein n=1 Tax=Arthrobacter sp. Leaf234 TaxID=1736303 RepID=UPI0006F6825B|nr:hypothetical protein [Arthrobacter sp. Leaf234]KQO01737.1 hypothetical protein ASF21_09070 [Arthrobacter sp. Leaf234]
MSTDRLQGTYDPRYEGIYQRGGATDAVPRMTSEAPPAPALPVAPPDEAAIPGIVEVGPDTARETEEPRPRNPLDVWIWVAAAVLTALGVYFFAAPSMYQRAFDEAMMNGQANGMYVNPWFNTTVLAAPPLILLGLATAVAQLFVLSIRHTLRTR